LTKASFRKRCKSAKMPLARLAEQSMRPRLCVLALSSVSSQSPLCNTYPLFSHHHPRTHTCVSSPVFVLTAIARASCTDTHTLRIKIHRRRTLPGAKRHPLPLEWRKSVEGRPTFLNARQGSERKTPSKNIFLISSRLLEYTVAHKARIRRLTWLPAAYMCTYYGT
jgi:hypothetical protein